MFYLVFSLIIAENKECPVNLSVVMLTIIIPGLRGIIKKEMKKLKSMTLLKENKNNSTGSQECIEAPVLQDLKGCYNLWELLKPISLKRTTRNMLVNCLT